MPNVNLEITAADVWAGRGTRSKPDDNAAAEDDVRGGNTGIR